MLFDPERVIYSDDEAAEVRVCSGERSTALPECAYEAPTPLSEVEGCFLNASTPWLVIQRHVVVEREGPWLEGVMDVCRSSLMHAWSPTIFLLSRRRGCVCQVSSGVVCSDIFVCFAQNHVIVLQF